MRRCYGSRPSGYYNDGRPRWSNEDGIHTYDLAAMGNDLVNGSRGLFNAARKANEPSGGLLNRVVTDLRRSLEKGFAPILVAGFRAPDGQYFTGHAVALMDLTSRDGQAEMRAYDSRSLHTYIIDEEVSGGSATGIAQLRSSNS
jgi:hypothetical protein